MRKILILLLLLPCLETAAQQPGKPLDQIQDTLRTTKLLGYGYADMGSNAITSQLFSTLLFSTEIDRESRESVLPKLKDNNRAGIASGTGIMARWGKYYAGYSYKMQEGLEFTSDIYRLAAFGNADAAGENMQLSPTGFNKITWQEIQGGMRGMLNKKSNLFGSIGIGLAGGNNYRQLQINRGYLYTSAMADTLRLDADANARYTDEKTDFFNYQGIGFAINGYLKYYSGKNTYSIAIENAGMMHWGKSSNQTLNLNQKVEFTGVEISVASHNFVSGNWRQGPDSLYNQIKTGWKREAFSQMLPMRLEAAYAREISEKTKLNAGVEYLMFYYSKPEIYVNGITKLGKKGLAVMYGLNAGGYTPWSIEAGINYEWKGLGITLSTTQLEGWIMPKKSSGKSLYFTLSYEL